MSLLILLFVQQGAAIKVRQDDTMLVDSQSSDGRHGHNHRRLPRVPSSTSNEEKDKESQSSSILWYEVLPPELLSSTPSVSWISSSLSSSRDMSLSPRRTIWWGRYDEEQSWKKKPVVMRSSSRQRSLLLSSPQQPSYATSNSNNGSRAAISHPLRSSRYHTTLQWYNNRKGNKLTNLPHEMQLEFDLVSGYCRATMTTMRTVANSNNNNNNNTNNDTTVCIGIGEWDVRPWGLFCQLWFQNKDDNDDDDHHTTMTMTTTPPIPFILTAGLHLNPFGKHAKLVQGSIVLAKQHDNNNYPTFKQLKQKQKQRRRPLGGGGGGGVPDPIQDEPMVKIRTFEKWFRPVVGRFTGISLGEAI